MPGEAELGSPGPYQSDIVVWINVQPRVDVGRERRHSLAIGCHQAERLSPQEFKLAFSGVKKAQPEAKSVAETTDRHVVWCHSEEVGFNVSEQIPTLEGRVHAQTEPGP